jgi:nucleotidyltransferase AbiEii toxin of type IV toxin-antitoxin system
MKNRFSQYIQVLKAFEREKVDYILVGGVAVILYGMQRLTRDVDIFIKMVPQNIKRLRKALHSLFEDPAIEEITINELREYPVIRYVTPDGFYIDILSRLGEAAYYGDLEYKVIELHDTRIRIATAKTLYRLKKDTVRPEDKMDAMFLENIIDRQD